jgi:membrane bound O-acyltransferase family protein
VNAYLPSDLATCGIVLAILAGELAAGFAVTHLQFRRLTRLFAWLMTIAATAGVERLTAAEPPGVRMLAIILALLYGMKTVVTVESGTRLSMQRWLGFSVLWFGMRPGLFSRAGNKPLSGSRDLLVMGLGRLVLGLGLIFLARAIWEWREWLGAEPARWLATAPLLAGLSLALHFGVFNVLAAFWRWRGVDCRPLFRAPILSTSLNEFWSKRWNLAFSEMTALAIYRPISAVAGRRAALITAFFASGLLHELAISVPVLAGFGGPSLYFLLHGCLILIETGLARIGVPLNARPWIGRVWTLAALIVPLQILFHRPFLAGIVWPIVGIE